MPDIIQGVKIVVDAKELINYNKELDVLKKNAEEAQATLDGMAAAGVKAGQAAAAAGDGAGAGSEGAKKIKKEMEAATTATQALEKTTGFLNKALTGFGVLGAVSAAKGLYDLYKSLHAYTDAGKEALLTEAAHKSALEATLSVITGVSNATQLATRDIVGYYKAKVDAEKAEAGIREALKEHIRLEEELAAALSASNRIVIGETRDGALIWKDMTEENAEAVEKATKALKANDTVLTNLKGTLRSAARTVTGLNDEFDRSGGVVQTFTAAIEDAVERGTKAAAQADKDAADRARRQQARLGFSQSLRDQELALIEDAAARELAILDEKNKRDLALFDAAVKRGEADAGDRDRLVAVQAQTRAELEREQAIKAVEAALDSSFTQEERATEAAERRLAMLEGYADREIALIGDKDARAAAQMQVRHEREREALEKAIAEGTALEEDRTELIGIQAGEQAAAVEDAANRKAEAEAKSASAIAASGSAAIGAAAGLAEAFGASTKVIAGINVAKEGASAASEIAAAAASAAVYDVPGAIAHGVAAASHIAAAVEWGSDLLGGGGGKKPASAGASGGSGGASAPSAAARESAVAPAREREERVLNINLHTGQALATKNELSDLMVRGINAANSRRSAPKIDTRRVRGRR